VFSCCEIYSQTGGDIIYEPMRTESYGNRSNTNQYNGGGIIYKPMREHKPYSTLKDGTYKVMAKYKNSSTNYSAEYFPLTVEVENDMVVQINFPKGGFIHYQSPNIVSYSGGYLTFVTELGKHLNYYSQPNENIVGAYTTVEIKEDIGSLVNYFYIEIQ